MLHEFLEEQREAILALADEKTVKLAGPLASSVELRKGLPIFYEYLIEFLRHPSAGSPNSNMIKSAGEHGKELLRLHYTLSHVVHSYGAMCQAITELAQIRKADMSAQEFNDLNLCLDIAIAASVSEFQHRNMEDTEEREIQHMGILVHELRNALSSATIAQEMIRRGLVGTAGSTARVLEANLATMRNLIDRSLSDIRMRADPEVHIEKFQLNVLVDQILLTAQSEASIKNQTLKNDVDPNIELETDRQLLLSIIANLTQNGLKYSKINGKITVRGTSVGDKYIVEIQDECGGIEPRVAGTMFKPFVSGGFDQTGMGLGLTIVQRAVALLQGKISILNHEGSGCSFKVELPKKFSGARAPQPKSVSGEDSAQPVNKDKKRK